MYKVLDNYGTRKNCWTLSGAYAWLPYCSPVAVIMNRFTGKVVARRWIAEQKLVVKNEAPLEAVYR